MKSELVRITQTLEVFAPGNEYFACAWLDELLHRLPGGGCHSGSTSELYVRCICFYLHRQLNQCAHHTDSSDDSGDSAEKFTPRAQFRNWHNRFPCFPEREG